MAEYIERRVAAKAACDAVWYGGGAPSVTDAINKIPAADVVPVRSGHWVKSDIPDEDFRCSECGGACWYYDCGGAVTKSKYCPNCGAEMDGKVKEHR